MAKDQITSQRLLDQSQASLHPRKTTTYPPFWAYSCSPPTPTGRIVGLTPCKIIILSKKTHPLWTPPGPPPTGNPVFDWGWGGLNKIGKTTPPPCWGLKTTNLLVLSHFEPKTHFLDQTPKGLWGRSGKTFKHDFLQCFPSLVLRGAP